MGYFTFTYADVPGKKLPYGGKGFVAMPDGSFVGEDRYDGCCVFGGRDVFDLVVYANRDHLKEIFEALEKEKGPGCFEAELKDAAVAYQERDDAALAEAVRAFEEKEPSCEGEWKRNVGIAITQGGFNGKLPFPLKITSTDDPRLSYEALPPSAFTQ